VSTDEAEKLQPRLLSATCQAPAGTDAAGNPITYEAERTLDGRPETAWRCEGAAVGVRLVYEFYQPMAITAVGLIPGYAKIDPTDGTDRFLENYTVTAVEWQFDGGQTHRQSIPAPRPTLTMSELPVEVVASQVVLEITDTGNPGAAREFTAISDVAFTGFPIDTE
jgi:hypothetical protein